MSEAIVADAATPSASQSSGRWNTAWRYLRRTPRFWIGVGALVVVFGIAIFGHMLSPWDPETTDPLALLQPPSASHWFGTNEIGQDLLSQTVEGLRKSLVIGFIAGPGASLISAIVGSIAGYFGKRVDTIMMWITDLLLVFPTLFLLIILSPIFRATSWLVLVVFLAFTGWMLMARVVRGQTVALRDRDFVKAARYMGVTSSQIIRRHILPNVASLLIVDATIGVGSAILSETTLSYFGLGVQPPSVSLGTLLNDGSTSAVTQPWLFLFPAAAVIVTVLATSLIGDALRDAIDPSTGGRHD